MLFSIRLKKKCCSTQAVVYIRWNVCMHHPQILSSTCKHRYAEKGEWGLWYSVEREQNVNTLNNHNGRRAPGWIFAAGTLLMFYVFPGMNVCPQVCYVVIWKQINLRILRRIQILRLKTPFWHRVLLHNGVSTSWKNPGPTWRTLSNQLMSFSGAYYCIPSQSYKKELPHSEPGAFLEPLELHFAAP